MNPVIALDTCVVKQMFAFDDLMKAASTEGTPEAALRSTVVAYRVARVRDSILLAWACQEQNIEARCMQGEVGRILTRDVDPERRHDPATAFTQMIIHFVSGYVLSGFRLVSWNDEPAGLRGNAADEWLVARAKADGIPVITEEGNGLLGRRAGGKGLRERAARLGVPVFTPAEYLSTLRVDASKGARDFMRTFERTLPQYVAERGARGDEKELAAIAEHLEGTYRLVLLGEVADELGNVPRASWPTVP
jgi:hypothetical protein